MTEGHPRGTMARVWPVLDHWRYDVQHPGPPDMHAAGQARDEAGALRAAVAELLHIARAVAGK